MKCQKCNGELNTGMFCLNCGIQYTLGSDSTAGYRYVDISKWKPEVDFTIDFKGLFEETFTPVGKHFAGMLFGIPIYCNSEEEVIELEKRIKPIFWVSEYESRKP